MLLFLFFIYMLPAFIAAFRGKANGGIGIFLLNAVLGWTVVGWVVCFIWAFTGKTKADLRREEWQHRQLIAAIGAKQ